MKNYPVPAKEDDPYYITAVAGNLDVASHKGRTPLSKLRSNATSDTTSKRDACRADKIVAKEEVREKEVSKASSLKTQPMKPPKASALEAVKSSKADTSEIKSGKVFKAVGPKANGKDKALNSAKKVTRIESDEDSEEELLAETRKLLAAPLVPPPTASPSKSPCMQVEVVLKSLALAKPKNGKSTSAIKAKSKLQRVPMADHDSDEEVVEEPRRKCKAQDPCPPPAPKPKVKTQPESAEDKDRSNKHSLHDPTPEPEPKVKQPAKGTKAKPTSSKAHRKHSSHAPTPHPQAETDQAAEETEPDPELSKQKALNEHSRSFKHTRCPKTPSPEPGIDEDDEDEYQSSSETNRPKKRARQDQSTRHSKVPERPSEVDEPKEDEDEDKDGLKPKREPPKKRSRQDQ
ncbi:hypothetical protein FRC11_002072, partial [Ceratobasidium sp. 423]